MLRRLLRIFWLGPVFAMLLAVWHVHSETVDVKYRGTVELALFDCTDVERSSFVKRICFDRGNSYMLINLNGTYYHYCEIDDATVSALLHADSVGRFFNDNIRGHFDCRTHHVPHY